MKEITDKDIYDAAEYYLQQWFETNDYDNVNRYPSEIDTELKDAFIAGVMWLIDNADEEPNKKSNSV